MRALRWIALSIVVLAVACGFVGLLAMLAVETGRVVAAAYATAVEVACAADE